MGSSSRVTNVRVGTYSPAQSERSALFLENPNRLRNRYLFGEDAEGKRKKMISKNLIVAKLFRLAAQGYSLRIPGYPLKVLVCTQCIKFFRLLND